MQRFPSSALVVSFALLTGCYSVRSAVVPDGYLPSRVGSPLERSELRVAFESGASLEAPAQPPPPATRYQQGAFIPRFHVGASVAGNVFTSADREERLEIGGQLRLASSLWSQPNVAGLSLFPAGSDTGSALTAVWGGAEIRYDHLDPSGLFVGGTLQLDLALVPEVVWYTPPWSYAPDQYDSQGDFFFLPAAFAHVGARIGGGFSLYALAGLRSGIHNVFDPANYGGSLERTTVVLAGAGAEFRSERFFATATAALPFTSDEFLRFGPSVNLQVGFSFGGR
jgi:hypothetical protein